MSYQNHYLKKQLISYDSLIKLPLVSHIRQKEKLAIHKLLHQKIKTGEKVLEVGCGSGYYTREIVSITPYVSCIEESVVMIEQLKRQFGILNENLPEIIVGRFPESTPLNTFDHVVAISVLEYIDNPEAFLKTAIETANKSFVFTAMSEYPMGKFGKQVAKTLFRSHIFPHCEQQLRQTLKPYSVKIQRISVFKPLTYTTLVCSVNKS